MALHSGRRFRFNIQWWAHHDYRFDAKDSSLDVADPWVIADSEYGADSCGDGFGIRTAADCDLGREPRC